MARSRYIYVVTNYNGFILATYTVKHELITALAKLVMGNTPAVVIGKYPDNGTFGEYENITAKILQEAKVWKEACEQHHEKCPRHTSMNPYYGCLCEHFK